MASTRRLSSTLIHASRPLLATGHCNPVTGLKRGILPIYTTSVRHNTQHRVVLLPQVPKDTPESNPMLYPYTSQTFPRFENITNRDCFNALGKSLLEFEAEVLHFEDKCKQGTTDFDELFSAIDAVKCQFETVWSLVNLMQLVTDKLDSDTFIKLHDRAKRSLSSRLNSDVIYQHLKKLLDAHGNDKPFLTPEQEHTLLRFMVEFKHQGFHLVANKQEELHGNWLKNLMGKKADYKLRMRINNDRYQHTMYNAEVVKDFPLDVLKAMAHDSTQPSRGPWTLTLHPYVYKQHMAYCPDRQLRYGAHYAHVTRGSKQVDVESHVTAITFDIRQLRLDQAVCLGYKSYAQVSMDSKMAKSTENVHALIKNLAGKAKESQESELDALQSYAESRGFDEELQTYDVEYFKRKQRRTILGMSDDDMRDFFPLPRVLEGINRLSSRLFGIDYVQVEDSLQQGAWHPDTQLWAVRDVKTQQILGHFYLDPYMRDDKGYAGGDHGWYVPIRAGCKFGPSKPLGAMVFALPSASAGKPSLLSFFEAQEVLRNFGLMLQHILCQNEYTDNSGKKGMEVDALNFAGDFMSLLIHNASVLRSLSGHWKYKQPLAEETIQHLCTTIKHHMAGYDLCRELYLAEFDLLFHSDDPDDYQDIEENLYKEYFLLPKVNGDSAPLYFADIIAGEMAGAKFGQIWSRMLAADAFSAIEEAEADDVLSCPKVQAVTMRFRETVLATGSRRHMTETFRKFRGRDPSHEALLFSLGLKQVNHPHLRGS